jgi:hypothetical protein
MGGFICGYARLPALWSDGSLALTGGVAPKSHVQEETWPRQAVVSSGVI